MGKTGGEVCGMMQSTKSRYKSDRRRKKAILTVTAVLLLVVVVGASGQGAIAGWSVMLGEKGQAVINIRLPRIIAAVECGWALGLSGSVMQTLLRNPLASPYTLGISNAAAFGAGLMILLMADGGMAVESVSEYAIPIGAFASSMGALSAILLIARKGRGNGQTIVLAGIIISALFGAALDAVQYLSTSNQLATIIFWTFGNMGNATWKNILLVTVVLVPSTMMIYKERWSYRTVSAGDDYARSVGVNPERTRITGLTIVTLSTAVVVAFYGVIAFIGLVVPHIMRKLVGSNEEYLLPASAIGGAIFLLVSDTVARNLFAPTVVPVGIVTTVVGAPIFLFQLIKMKRL